MESTVLNKMQLKLLRLFQHSDEESLLEMRAVLLKFIHDKIDSEGEQFWIDKGMSKETLQELLSIKS